MIQAADSTVALAKLIYAENQAKLAEYLDWFRDEELSQLLPTGYTAGDAFMHLLATRCIVANRMLIQPSPLPWQLVTQFSRHFPPRSVEKEHAARSAISWLLAETYSRLEAGLSALVAEHLDRSVFDARYRRVALAEKLVTQAAHEVYHIGMIAGFRSVVVIARENPDELRDYLAAHPCELSDRQIEDARILSE